MLKTDGDDEIPINGDVYLQKLVQIPFNLPPLDLKGRVEFIQTLEKDLPADFQLDKITRQVFGRGLYPNPRQVKRALNVFYLLKQVALEQEKQGLIPEGVLAFPLLAKTVLIQSQWPELYKLWRQYPTLIQTLEDEYTRQPVSEDELLRGNHFEEIAEEAPEGMANAARQVQARPAARPTATGLMAPFLNERQKYALLAEMLRYPEESGEGALRARFGGLKRAEVQIYVGLVGAFEQTAAESAESPLVLSEDWLRDLESGDPAKIREIIAALNEREPDPNGPRHASLRKQLVSIAQNPDLPPPARANAADAADGLGFVPNDLYAFVPIRKQDDYQFYIARYPVTNLQYQRFLNSPDFLDKTLWLNFPEFNEKGEPLDKNTGESGWNFLCNELKRMNNKILFPYEWRNSFFGFNRSTAPVVGISWWEANAYCRWLERYWQKMPEAKSFLPSVKSADSLKFRLPTESEWVFSAMGDSDNLFTFGHPKDVNEVLIYANINQSGINQTTSVWMYSNDESSFRTRSMNGNVWEWQGNYAFMNENWVALKGGSWNDGEQEAQNFSRSYFGRDVRSKLVGFRIVAVWS